MPIALICGACDATLTAPDAAAGKRVKCRKCGVILEVPFPEPDTNPDYEVIEDAPTMMLPPIKKALPPPVAAKAPPPAAAKPKPKPVVLEEDDDEDDRPAPKKKPKMAVIDDDDEDDRPLPRKKPTKKPAVIQDDDEDDFDDEPRPKKGKKGKAKKAAGGGMLPLLIGGGVLGLAAVGFLVYWFVIREPELSTVKPGPAPQNSGVTGGNGPPPMPPGQGGGGGPKPGGQVKPPPGPQPGGNVNAPPPGWKEFTAPEFKTWVPTRSRKSELKQPARPKTLEGKAYDFSMLGPNGDYTNHLVSILPLDPGGVTAAKEDAASVLEAFYSRNTTLPEAQFGMWRDTVIDTRPGRAVEVKLGKRILYVRSILDGNRVFVLAVGVDDKKDSEDSAKLFFDNFKITAK